MINNRQNGRRRGRGGGQQRPQGNNSGGQRDSGNRIDSRARGNAVQLHEKYKNMARDAQMSDDRVNTEYYLQFADHYFRVMADQRGRNDEQGSGQGAGQNSGQRRGRDDFDSDDDFGFEGEPVRADEQPRAAEDGRRESARGDDNRGNYQRDSRSRDNGQTYQRDDNRDQPRDQSGRDQNGRDQSRDQNGRDGAQRDGYQRDAAPRDGQRDGQRDGGTRYDKRRNTAGYRSDDRGQQTNGDDQSPAPVTTDAPTFTAPASNVDVATDVAPEPKRRGRPRKQRDDAPTGDAAENGAVAGFDAAILPPSLGSSTPEGSDAGEEAPKPRRRRTAKAIAEADAAE